MAKMKKRSDASSKPPGSASASTTSAPTQATESAPPSGGPPRSAAESKGARHLVGLYMRFGWTSLLAFILLGTALEAMHGFKIGWYLDVGNETRRLMWTLAHAHGVLLSLVHIASAITVAPAWSGGAPLLASRALMTASILMPLGFLLGGVFIYGGDPGLGIFLVPIGALALFLAVFLIARAPFRT